ncbi:MAG: CDP-glycerol glycerophosphotransferase family protein [Lachnospiraceae bacterium]|uniref:CDP-glycerol glycerophosphotransferase family protein n=1 Tax=Parablautia sp. Marseille-Q6255 TaxID=3039593 RepID=UPI0024BC2104|nr:CDP-glycerol glycerophosphotransferase family protein [Parablautia sp. Marseille-Q6255]
MFRIRQYIKMFLQNVLLPVVYACFRHAPIREGSVIFADAHHTQMPFSMRRMYEEVCELERQGKCRTELFVCDFGSLSSVALARYLLRFMKQYATAQYVFICDYYLPVASCKKRSGTTVVQLWHSCGLMKKIAYDTGQDIPKNYKGDMFGNYSYLTLSAEVCVPVHARALRLAPERICATGVSRTDYYFDKEWKESCKERFYSRYPQAKGKRIVLWAPTFRGNAAMPRLEGLEEMRSAVQELGEAWYLIVKAHPHVDAHGAVSNCELPTEELLPVADVLVTDYSSVLFDYLLYEKPAVLFAPDLQEYEAGRGFYLDYRQIPFPLACTQQELKKALCGSWIWADEHKEEISAFRREYVGACDGHATKRILKLAGLLQ